MHLLLMEMKNSSLKYIVNKNNVSYCVPCVACLVLWLFGWLYLLNLLFYCLWFVYFCLYFYSYGDQFLKPKHSTLSKPYCPFI